MSFTSALSTFSPEFVALIWLCRDHRAVTEEMLQEEYESRDAYFAGTTAEAYVKPFEKKRDGRKAFLSLRNQCGGPATVEARSARAHNIIESVKYTGTQRNFTITDYNAKYTKVFEDLRQCGDIIPQRRQVYLYLRGIQHPELKAGVSYVRGSLKNDFKAATQHMAEEAIALRDGTQLVVT
jgi:hypothetical protein